MDTIIKEYIVDKFICCCKHFSLECSIPKNILTKSKHADYQFIGLLLIKKIFDINTFMKTFIESIQNNSLFDFIVDGLYINIFIKIEAISKFFVIDELNISHKKNVLIDYSSPNIAKELHVGHLRSTIIGDSLANLYELFGHNVMRINHIGDWGSQFGLIIAYAKKMNIEIKTLNISKITEIYQQAKVLINKENKELYDEEFKKDVYKCVLLLQNNDSEILDIWKFLCDISRIEYLELYQKLDIKPIQEVGESFYNQYILHVIDILQQKNLLIESDGATIIKTKLHPLIIIKKNGGYTYDTTDLTALWYRTQVLKVDEIIYLTDNGQSSHFNCMFEIAENMGWLTNTICKHIGFGLILQNGEKISSRKKTNTTTLKQFIDDALIISSDIWKEKNNIENNVLSSHVAINCIKFYDLSHHYSSNYNFVFNDILKMDGKTATYIMYTLTRIYNILKISNKEYINVNFSVIHHTETKIALLLMQRPDILYDAYEKNQLHIIVDYVYKLADAFNSLYSSLRIIDSDNELSRLYLCHKTKETFELIFNVLGLKPLENM